MKRLRILIFVLMVVFVITGCAKQQFPTEDDFLVEMDSIPEIQHNQSFAFTASLTNTSRRAWKISHGADMFTYEIIDSEGSVVYPENGIMFINSIGYGHTLQPKATYRNNGDEQRSKAYYEYIIKEPGTYTVRSKVQFQVESNGDRSEFITLESEPKHFVVK